MATFPLYPPLVTLNVPDNRLDHPGYVHRWYPHEPHLWDDAERTDVWLWPQTNLITLTPEYDLDAAEAQLSEWDTAGTNESFIEVNGYRGADATILQQNPNATNCTLTSNFTLGPPDDNQAFYADFYLLAVTDVDWYADLIFSTRFGLRLLYNGVIQLWRNYAIGDDDADWRYCGSCETFDTIFNKRLRLIVYPTNGQMLLVVPEGFDPIQYIEPEPVVSENTVNLGLPTEATYPLRTICPSSEVTFSVTGGAFYFSYRYIDWPVSGELLLPRTAKPWEDDEPFELEHSVAIPRAGYDFDVDFDMLDEDGAVINPAAPAADFRYFTPRLQLTNCQPECSPEIYWGEFRVLPTSQVHAPGAPYPMAITDPGRLQAVKTSASYEGRHTAEFSLHNMDALVDVIADLLHVCTTVEVGADTVWKGYLLRREAPEEQSGNIQMNYSGRDPLDRLNVPLSDSYIGDGRIHTAYVELLFQTCGLAAADYIIAADPDNRRLPQSVAEQEPYFRATDGRFAKEMIEYVCRVWSGWELYCTMDGIIHYAPADTTGLPEKTVYGYQNLAADALTYRAINPQRDEERFYNYIVVIGQDMREFPIIAIYYDADSVSNPADANFLGYERLMVVVDSTLRTAEHVETALQYVVDWHGQPFEECDVQTDFDSDLDVRSIVEYDGDNWQVRSIGRDWVAGGQVDMMIRKVI